MLIARVAPLGAVAKLIARISAPTITTDRMPPRLSTGSSVSLTCAGTKNHAIPSATTTRVTAEITRLRIRARGPGASNRTEDPVMAVRSSRHRSP